MDNKKIKQKLNYFVALREAFAEFDKNHDGYISKEELAETMKKFGQDISEDEIDLMIKLADIDGKLTLVLSTCLTCIFCFYSNDYCLSTKCSFLDFYWLWAVQNYYLAVF